MPRKVTFCQFSEVAYVPKDEIEPKFASKWYTERELRRFQEELVQDARKMAHELNAAPSKAPSTETVCEAVGLEAFVSPRFAKQLIKMKKSHVAAVLSAQWLQEQQGLCCPETLSFVSERSSTPSVERAQRLAMGYSKLK